MIINDGIIFLNKELNYLDDFTIEFVNILNKYSDYALVSGYVSILFGRSRSSEDIDIIFKEINIDIFKMFFLDLYKNNFYCLNVDDYKIAYSYLKDNLSIRFAKNNTIIPNMEIKFAKSNITLLALNSKIKVILNNNELCISNIELQIAYKENALKSIKDLEDAKHLRIIFEDRLDYDLIEKYKDLILDAYR